MADAQEIRDFYLQSGLAPADPGGWLFTTGASIAILAQGGNRPTDIELQEILSSSSWSAPNCYFSPKPMSDSFSLDLLFLRCGGVLPYKGKLRRTIKGEFCHQPEGANKDKVSPAARHFALLLLHDEKVRTYESYRLLLDVWYHSERDRSQACPWSPWGGISGQLLEAKPAFLKEFRGTQEWALRMTLSHGNM